MSHVIDLLGCVVLRFLDLRIINVNEFINCHPLLLQILYFFFPPSLSIPLCLSLCLLLSLSRHLLAALKLTVYARLASISQRSPWARTQRLKACVSLTMPIPFCLHPGNSESIFMLLIADFNTYDISMLVNLLTLQADSLRNMVFTVE